jgi:hypothetical protein
MKFYEIVWNFMKFYEIVWNCMKLYEIVWNCMKLYEIVWNCIKLYEIVWNCMKLYEIVWNCMKFFKISQYIMAYYLDFIQLWCILETFSFAFGAFESLPQHFGLFQNGLKFRNFRLRDGVSWKSQYPQIVESIVGYAQIIFLPGSAIKAVSIWILLLG